MKKSVYFLLLSPLFAFSQIPAGYYDSASGLSGYALKSKLHEIISAKPYSYNYSDLPDFYATTDADHYYENDNTILDIYSERPASADAYSYTSAQLAGSSSAEGNGYNREHGMPQSTFYGIYPMYSDLHYVIPADAFINQRRSNYPYANNNASTMTFTNGSKLGKSTVPGYTNTTYEPIDEFKGDVARYLLYFVTRYEGSLNSFNYLLATSPLDGTEEKGFEDWYITMLKSWAAMDPVSQREIDRNNLVYNIDKIRNPFIDHPEYINLIWSQTPDSVAPESPANVSATAVGESFVSLSWSPSASSDALGYKIFANGTYIGFSKTNSFTADRLTPGTAYNFTVKTYDNGYLESANSNIVTATTSAADPLARDLMITKYIEGSTNNEALEITNKTGHPVNLNNYYLSIQFKSATSYYFSDTYQLEGTIAPGESKVVINPRATFPNFAVNQGDFVTAGTPMTYTGSQYIELSYGTKYLKTASTNNYDMSYATVDAVGYKNTTNTLGNQTLYRNPDVTDPNTTFTPSEWTQYPSNYTTTLGDDTTTTLGTTENIVKNNYAFVYPNPAKSLLYIKGENFRSNGYSIYDISGNLVEKSSEILKNNDFISTEKLPAGKYILKTETQSFSFIKN